MAWWNRAKEPSESTSVDPNLPLIRLEGVTKRFAGDADDTETFALNDVTVDIDRGEYISVSDHRAAANRRSSRSSRCWMRRAPAAITSTGAGWTSCRRPRRHASETWMSA